MSRQRVKGHLCVPEPVLWLIVLLLVVIGSSSFLLCHRRACGKWIRQSEWMCPWVPGEAGCTALAWPGSLPCPVL